MKTPIWESLTEKLLFVSLLLLPTQLTYFWWGNWSFVAGVRLDTLSIALSLWMIVAIVLIVVSGPRLFSVWKTIVPWIALVAIFNIWLSHWFVPTIYLWLRLLLVVLYGSIVWSKRVYVEQTLYLIVPVWTILELLLGLGQVATGASVQGLWWWAGERRFSYVESGIPLWSVRGESLVRMVGTFSHPNAMSGFFGITGFWWLVHKVGTRAVWWWVVAGGIGVILFFTGSRSTWGVLLFALAWYFSYSKKKALLVVFLTGILGAMCIMWFSGWDPDSLTKRLLLVREGLRTFVEHPLGIGMGMFVKQLYEDNSRVAVITKFQTIHNVVLLSVVEVGLIVLPFWWFLAKNLRKLQVALPLLVGVLLCMWDHYMIDSLQNMTLFAVMGGLYWNTVTHHETNVS